MFARKEVKKMQSIYRTITADKLTESLIGAHVTMCGWVENIRDHGGVSFIEPARLLRRCSGGNARKVAA